MHAKPNRCLFHAPDPRADSFPRATASQVAERLQWHSLQAVRLPLLRRRAFHYFAHNLPRPLVVGRRNINSCFVARILDVNWNFVFLHRSRKKLRDSVIASLPNFYRRMRLGNNDQWWLSASRPLLLRNLQIGGLLL